jgi:hypothetical protein
LVGPQSFDRTSWQQRCVKEEAAHLMANRKQRARKGLEIRYNLQRVALGTYFLQIGPTS